MENLQAEIISIAISIITVLVGVITTAITKYFNKKGVLVKLDAHKDLAKIVVNAVEQGYRTLNGSEKLLLAKKELIKLANERGIKIEAKDLELLIENAVKEAKESYKENK